MSADTRTPALSVCRPGDYSDYGGKSIVIESVEKRVAVVLGTDAAAKRLARIFAAAPDLLKALKEAQKGIRECYEDTIGTPSEAHFKEMAERFEVVIAKAEGAA